MHLTYKQRTLGASIFQEAEAKHLVQEAILAGVFNDLGSGSNVDVTTIKRVNGKVEVVQDINSIKPNEVSDLRNLINRDIVTNIPRGATRTLDGSVVVSWLLVRWTDSSLITCPCACSVACRRAELQVRGVPARGGRRGADGALSSFRKRATQKKSDGRMRMLVLS